MMDFDQLFLLFVRFNKESPVVYLGKNYFTDTPDTPFDFSLIHGH